MLIRKVVCWSWVFWLPSASFAADRYQNLEKLAKALHYIENMYVDADQVDRDQLVDAAIQGMLDQLDQHSTLLPKQAFKNLTQDTKGSFGGVGIVFRAQEGQLEIVSVVESSPAAEAGIQSGDILVGIDGIEITEKNILAAVDMIQGAIGSPVEMQFRRPAQGESQPKELVFTKTLVRRIIKMESVVTTELEPGFWHVKIKSFQEDTTKDLRAHLEDKKDLKGIILDLRNNPGGLLNQATDVSDLFIESGILVSTKARKESATQQKFARKSSTLPHFPVLILINEGSASASEIVAGALQDHKRALVAGRKSFGKGSVQTLVPLPDGSGLKLTIARYLTPLDRSIHHIGIEPDFIFADENSVYQNLVKKAQPAAKDDDVDLKVAHLILKQYRSFAAKASIKDSF